MEIFDLNKLEYVRDDQAVLEIKKAIGLGYRYAEEIKKSHIALKGVFGKELKPFLQRACIEYTLKDLQTKFPIKFKCSPQLNKKKNNTHIEVEFGRFILTESRVPVDGDLPRDAIYRMELCQINAPLFINTNSYPEKVYLILTHFGDKKPDYMNVMVPCKGSDPICFKLELEEEIDTPIENTDIEIPLPLKDLDLGKAINDEE